MPETQSRKLYRSQHERILAGVCGGVATYFSVDVALVRVLWAVLSLFNGLGILLYIACVIVVPEDPTPLREKPEKNSNRSTELTIGLVLLALGLVFLMRPTMPWHFIPPFIFMNRQNWMTLLPIVLIVVGIYVVIHSAQDRESASQSAETKRLSGRSALQRSRTQRMVGGVLGGFAENWKIDVSLVRIAYLVLSLASHPMLGVVLYLALWIFLPEEPRKKEGS